MSNEIISAAAKEAKAKLKTLYEFFETRKQSLLAVLPDTMTPDRMLAVAVQAMRRKPKLLDLEPIWERYKIDSNRQLKTWELNMRI